MNTAARLFIATAIIAHTGIVSAQPDESAESAFKRGTSALKAGRIHQACEAFEASEKLDAKFETEQSLANCYEQDGKPVTAARLYRSLAEKDTNVARRQASAAKASKLEATAPKLRFAINPMPAGLVIKVDGVEVSSTGDVLVDQGPHEVIATAPGFAGHASAPIDRDRAIVDVIIRMEPVAESAPAPTPEKAAPAAAPTPSAVPTPSTMPAETPAEPMFTATDHRKRNALIIGGGGVAMLAGAVVMFGLSSSRYDDEHAICPNARCANTDDLAKAQSLVSDGRTYRGISIGMGITSGVLLIASGYLLLTPHKTESRMSFHVQPGSATVAYTVSF